MLELDKRRRGLFIKLPCTEIVDLTAAAGFDFAVVDLEHSQLSEADASRLVRHAHAIGFPALVRLSEIDRGSINRLLEAGAAGIQLSTVRRASQVAELRSLTRYAPHGTRSISLAHPQAHYGGLALAGYVAEQAAAPPLVIAQLETATTEDPLSAILAAAPDVVFIGTTDLTVDVGLDHALAHARVQEIAAAVTEAGIALGAFGLQDDRVAYDLVSSDLALFRTAVRDAA
jgi:4-hydroxy-2-oxoheptanedioate aldolase